MADKMQTPMILNSFGIGWVYHFQTLNRKKCPFFKGWRIPNMYWSDFGPLSRIWENSCFTINGTFEGFARKAFDESRWINGEPAFVCMTSSPACAKGGIRLKGFWRWWLGKTNPFFMGRVGIQRWCAQRRIFGAYQWGGGCTGHPPGTVGRMGNSHQGDMVKHS